MSKFRVIAIERLGAPLPSWPTRYGPASGSDPIAANSLRSVDLTPYLETLQDFTQQMERDLTKGSFSGFPLTLEDKDGSLGDLLGPYSATLATTTRYYGPWIQVWEDYGSPTTSVLRFLGYIDDKSIQWSENTKQTKVSVKPDDQLLKERLLTDFPELLRPYPVVPTTATQSFAVSTADDILHAAIGSYTPRANKVALEQALWAQGQISWVAGVATQTDCEVIGHRPVCTTSNNGAPAAPAQSISIGSNSYLVDHIDWDTSISASQSYGASPDPYGTSTYLVARIYLQGAPDLSAILSLTPSPTTVLWGISETLRTHYLLASSVPAPASGSDGQRWMPLNTVEGLVAGDVLTITFVDTTSGNQRITTADLPPLVDVDGETGKVWFATPLQQAYSTAAVSKIRRNSQDPVLFDGLAYAQVITAPFGLDATYLQAVAVDVPVLAWRPYDAASPQLYGAHNIQTIDSAGTLQFARRGADNGSGAYTIAGIWQGNWSSGIAWKGLPNPSATHDQYGDVLQFPGGANPFKPPVIYTAGDLSGGATIPKNGWRNPWRTWKDYTDNAQDLESWWDGTVVQWNPKAKSGVVPATLVSFAASTMAPGRYTRTSGGTWTFEAHSADRTLSSGTTPSITGTTPTGSWIALGMGIYADPTNGHKEGLIALVATGTAFPWTAMKACLMSCGAGGALTVQQTVTLTITANGPWALGGGLVVTTWNETRGGATYPRSRLHLVDGRTTPLMVDFPTLEIIPSSIQPLTLAGTGSSRAISGWYALALETYEDSNYHLSRRLRFLWLNASLALKNGDLEPDPADPTNLAANFRRGEVVSSAVPDGPILARMVRTSNSSDAMAGMAGGRIFSVDMTIPTTVEHLKVGGEALSGSGLSVSDFLEKFAALQIATALPSSDGSTRMVSRAYGNLRLRFVNGKYTSVQGSERGDKTKLQTWMGHLRKARVTYDDPIAASTQTVEVLSGFDGGSILDTDYSDVLDSATAARALGRAQMSFFGNPQPVLTETWVDRTNGANPDKGPTFYADWQVGDLVTFDLVDPSTGPWTVTAYKILSMQPGLEARSVKVQLVRLNNPQPVGSVGWVQPGWVQPGWVSGGAS